MSTREAHFEDQLVWSMSSSTACVHHTLRVPTCARHSGSISAGPLEGTRAVLCRSPKRSVFWGDWFNHTMGAAQAGRQILGATFGHSKKKLKCLSLHSWMLKAQHEVNCAPCSCGCCSSMLNPAGIVCCIPLRP